MENRRAKLQKQIIEALEASDNNLYALLKSQWAHRYGVESLEELKNLDLTYENQNDNNEENLKNEQYQEDHSSKDFNKTYLKDDNSQDKVVINDINKEFKSVEVESKGTVEAKSYEIAFEKDYDKNTINYSREHTSSPKVEALIPLPP